MNSDHLPVREKVRRHFRPIAVFLLVCSLVSLSACLPVPEPAPQATVAPTATVTKTPTSTATIVWFPPTATFTEMPTQVIEPTIDLRPVLGALVLEDDFTNQTFWQTSQTSVGSVAYGKSELTLAVKQSRGTLTSLRKSPQLNNFYLEIDALPSLCRDGDTYGLLLRAASSGDFYRLMVNCSGQVRMERVKNSKATLLQDWITSGQVLPGGMLRTRLGVAAQGEELRVFINGVYHFSVKDPVFASGVVGVFARSAGDTPLTVSFSNLIVHDLSTARLLGTSPTPTPRGSH